MEAGEGRSSSNDLSSAPNSDTEGPFPHSTAASPAGNARSHPHLDNSTITVQSSHKVGNVANGRSALPATLEARQETDPDPPLKVRRPRKKKDLHQDEVPEKEKKTRKPRGSTAAGTTIAARKKQQRLEQAGVKLEPTVGPPRPSALHPEESRVAKPASLTSSLLNSAPDPRLDDAAKLTQFGFTRQSDQYESPKATTTSESRVIEHQPQFTPRSSGIYDPVRQITHERPPSHQFIQTPPRVIPNASASPSISSIINPPAPVTYSTMPPTSDRVRSDDRQPEYPNLTQARPPEIGMEVDPPQIADPSLRKPSLGKKPSSEGPSSAPSPSSKPARAKEQPPPIPQGSGLLSATLFGGDPKKEEENSGVKGQSIQLEIDLKSGNNQVINFSRLVEEKYGFAALYPRQAAAKERLARIAAVGAALERSASSSKLGGSNAESGDDDHSVDIDRDSDNDGDNDGDIMMSGINGGNETGANSGTDGVAVPKRRRKRKVEDYDGEDPFVDDSELIWESQAATSKDGFFVYCGPLISEGEKPAVERADGTVKRGRGRGRGGGPGSRGGRGGAAQRTHEEGGGGRGGGPGSRGGTTTRKPRITKADRAMREQEKANREKMATLAAKPPTYPQNG